VIYIITTTQSNQLANDLMCNSHTDKFAVRRTHQRQYGGDEALNKISSTVSIRV
jgi:hypothetical protein